MDVLINHPHVGSLWLGRAYFMVGDDGREYVVGEVWDDSDVGSPYLPDDYRGQPVVMNFLSTCVRKIGGTLYFCHLCGTYKPSSQMGEVACKECEGDTELTGGNDSNE